MTPEIKTTNTFEITTRTGRKLTLTFTYPLLQSIVEFTRLQREKKTYEACMMLFASCLAEAQRHLVTDPHGDILLALMNGSPSVAPIYDDEGNLLKAGVDAGQSPLDVLIEHGYSTFLAG